MITTNFRGGLGNVMFKVAAVIGTARDNGVGYVFSKDFIRPGIDPDYERYGDNILRNIRLETNLLSVLFKMREWDVYQEKGFHYSPVQYSHGTNLLLDGFFQSDKYFENHKQHIIDLFKPTDQQRQQIVEAYPDINNFVSIHVRRGDYLNFPDHHPQMTSEYFRKAVKLLDINKTFLIFSDDLKGCEQLFDFIPNKYFFTSGADWMDLYVMSLCGDNIICNSSFSWWGAYLNENPNKKVIAPAEWFGPAYSHYDVSDIYPSTWIKL